ncbi:OsmC family peroxiredoxin [Candidatus Thorarchaeota archaeon]|nr:MAG: OsmC family peroxiredoxin [Candidatus Thorarchaeota archaeon]
MSDESHTYEVKIDWTHDRIGDLIIEDKPTVQIATPPEFEGGVPGIISPEDLFVASAATCMMTTFVTFSKKMRFEFESFSCKGIGTLERGEKGFEFTRILLKSTVTVESEDLVSKAERALELAGKYCLVANSMKCQVDHENVVDLK